MNYIAKTTSLAAILCLGLSALSTSPGSAIDLVTTTADETPADVGVDARISISGDGRYVVFSTAAAMLPEDTNGTKDVYWKDRQTRELRLISRNGAGEIGNGHSTKPVISADGNFVVYTSTSTNLVANDTNSRTDAFVVEISTGAVTLVSRTDTGALGNGNTQVVDISDDGATVCFSSASSNLVSEDTDSLNDIFVVDVDDPTTIRLATRNTMGASINEYSLSCAISGNGNFVVFQTGATDVDPLDTDNFGDIYAYSRDSNQTTLVSVNSAGTASGNRSSYEPSINYDGSLIAFHSSSTDLDPNYTTTIFYSHIFVRDMVTEETHLVSLNSNGNPSDQGGRLGPHAISASGKIVAFSSQSTDLGSTGSNAGTYNLYFRNLVSDEIVCISNTADGAGPNEYSDEPSVSADGNFLAFTSRASNLVRDDKNGLDVTDGYVSPGTDLTTDPAAILRAQLLKKLQKLKKKMRQAKRKQKVAKVKRFRKKISKLKRQIQAL